MLVKTMTTLGLQSLHQTASSTMGLDKMKLEDITFDSSRPAIYRDKDYNLVPPRDRKACRNQIYLVI